MTPPPVDPNAVLMTGENSFIRLSHDGGKTLADRASHWRVLWCPAGPGHMLFAAVATLTGGKPRIYSDNLAVARWLQTSIETMLFPAFADTNMPVIAAASLATGDPRSTAVETRDAGDRPHPPDLVRLPSSPSCSTCRPASTTARSACSARSSRRASAQLELNGRFATGKVWAGDARRPAGLERVPGLVGDLGQAALTWV